MGDFAYDRAMPLEDRVFDMALNRLGDVIASVGDVREEPPGDALAEMGRMHIHDAQRHVGRPGVVEAGARDRAGVVIHRQDAAAGIERFIDLAEQPRRLGWPRENRWPSVRLIPGVGGASNQRRHLIPVSGIHRSQRVGHAFAFLLSR